MARGSAWAAREAGSLAYRKEKVAVEVLPATGAEVTEF